MAFLGVPCSDEFGNANGTHGKSCRGSLGYAMVDAICPGKVVLLTEALVPVPQYARQPVQDQVTTSCRWRAWDRAKISVGAARHKSTRAS